MIPPPRSGSPPNMDEGDAASEPRGQAREDLELRLRFLGLSERDAELLRPLEAAYEAFRETFVARFYEHLFGFEETARFLRDPTRVERLKRAQEDHLRGLLAARWDQQFARERQRVGEAHAEVGIEPQWFLGAYSQYLQHCLPAFARQQEPGELDWILALFKAVLLDIGLTLDAYFQQSTQDLKQALDMLWKANAELRQFAQLTSHDLKTPLATVSNICEEVLDEFGEQIPPEARRLIESGRQRIFRMSSLINELLAAAVAAPEFDGHDEVSMQGVIHEAVDRVRPLLDEKRIELAQAERFPPVWGNYVRLREVFYNLLSNAAKFIDRPDGRIEISARTDGPHVVYCVADNGPGIPPEEIDRVFVPFRRLPMHRDRPGSGLGLYFTKSIIEHIGGRVWCESTLGEGSRFYVALRASQERRKSREPRAS